MIFLDALRCGCNEETRAAVALNRRAARRTEVRQQGREEADQREVGANVEDKRKAAAIGEGAEEGGAEAAQAEGEAEKEAGHRADFAGDEFLSVNENGGKGGGQDEADYCTQHGAPEESGVGEREGERRHAEDRNPDDRFAADAIAHGSAEEGAGGNGGEKNEEMQLRVLNGEAEFLDEEKRVVAAHAREVEILRENEHDQNGQGEDDALAGQAGLA